MRVPGGRDELQQRLTEAGIGSAVHYPVPIDHQPIIRRMGFGLEADVPIAEAAAASVLSLPVHPSLTAEDIAHIAAVVNG